jgi:hypothetical protein
MKNIQSLLPALIIALAVLAGLLGGAKIISSGVVEANRFQVIDAGTFFDSATGRVFTAGRRGWDPLFGHQYLLNTLKNLDVYSWVEYLEETKWEIKDARKEYHD